MRRILSRLAKAGLVVTEKGPHGGSRLGLSAAKITLGRIYAALESTRMFKSFEKRPYKPCPISCGIKGALDDFYSGVEKSALAKMDGMTLARFLKTIPMNESMSRKR